MVQAQKAKGLSNTQIGPEAPASFFKHSEKFANSDLFVKDQPQNSNSFLFSKNRTVEQKGLTREKNVKTQILAGLFSENRKVVDSLDGTSQASITRSYFFGLYKETKSGVLDSNKQKEGQIQDYGSKQTIKLAGIKL